MRIELLIEVFTAWCRNSKTNSNLTNHENYTHSFLMEDVLEIESCNNTFSKFITSLFSEKLIFPEIACNLLRYLSAPKIRKPMKIILSRDSLSFIGLVTYDAIIEKTFMLNDIVSVRSNFYDGSVLIIKLKDHVIRCDTGLTLGAIPLKETIKKLL